ncbi:SDR family NAD(P)-dependent oxidoreductase [Oscillospiraceae bacterium 38-13]
MELELHNRIAVVTGATQGIGASIADVLRREGATVVVADMNAEAAEAKAAELGGDCTACAVNISQYDQLQALVDFVIDKYGRIDILVNNAGVARQVDFLDITQEEFDRVLNINLKGTVFLSQLSMAQMIRQNYGRIINIASLAGERGGLFAGIHYSASKAGVIVATKCMAHKGGGHNVTANAVAPGLIMTPMGKDLQFSTNEIAMKRLGTPQEVAEVVAFLASDRASYITGSTVDVNGGIFMR